MSVDNEQIKKLETICVNMRKNALKMALLADKNTAHLGGGLSAIEIMAVLYKMVMNVNVSCPTDEMRDRFIMSKGHGVLAYYTALHEAGFVTKDELETFKSNNTFLYGHPCRNLEKGIEFSSGSLGQGLGLGVGSALALKQRGNSKSRVFVLLGDGECDEGSVWEAAASASHYKLCNLFAIVDKNKLQYDGQTSEVLNMDDMAQKWEAFGWNAISVDGHSIEALYDAFTTRSDKPVAVIANTVKGKGVSFMENSAQWHNQRLTQTQYAEAMKEQESL